jgi:hypothetical protein
MAFIKFKNRDLSIILGSQHRPFAFLSPAATGVFRFELIRQRLIAHEPIVEGQLFTTPNLPTGVDEDASIHLHGFAIGSARMVDPARGITTVQSINYPRVVDVKVKRVLGVAWVVWVATLRLSHGDDFAHVLNDPLACGHVAQGKHAFAVDAG